MPWPAPEKPDISIVVVAHGRAELTFECLRRLHLDPASGRCELVLVDNASRDRTPNLFARIPGATVLRNKANLHFLDGANQGAAFARGGALLFVNTDAFVSYGAVGRALETLRETGAGAVGGLIVLPDGTVQEAGSIVWSDGSCAGYGRGGSPSSPEHGFRRKVDYCSGCFLMTPRPLFMEMGGFDISYRPAYYEESDYCMRLWARGLPVIYEPRCLVVHQEGASSGPGESGRLQMRNRGVFAARHQAALRDQPPPGAMLRGRSRARTHILIVDDRVPRRDLGAGLPRAVALADACASLGIETTSFGVFGGGRSATGVGPDVEVIDGNGCGGIAGLMAARPGHYHAAIVSRPHNLRDHGAAVVADLALHGRPLIYDAEAVFALRDAMRDRVLGRPRTAEAEEAAITEEMSIATPAACVICVSESEAALVRAHGRAAHVVGHSVEARAGTPGVAQRQGLLFVGPCGEGTPNEDSLLWFAAEVRPLLKAMGLDPAIQVVGAEASPQTRVALPDAQFIGRLDDAALADAYDRHRAVIAPTRWAAGIPMKIHGAAANGVPVVATRLVAGQVGWTDGIEIMAADDADGFARRVAALLRDDALWLDMRDRAAARVAAECSPEAFQRAVAGILASVGIRGDGP